VDAFDAEMNWTSCEAWTGQMGEVAQVAAWLLPDVASFVNGITVSIVAASPPERPEMNAEDRMSAAHKRRNL
jgi:hypothetical protein